MLLCMALCRTTDPVAQVGFETEGTAIYDTMCYVNNEVHTVGVGAAMGQACMLLSAGHKGKRFMQPNATGEACVLLSASHKGDCLQPQRHRWGPAYCFGQVTRPNALCSPTPQVTPACCCRPATRVTACSPSANLRGWAVAAPLPPPALPRATFEADLCLSCWPSLPGPTASEDCPEPATAAAWNRE